MYATTFDITSNNSSPAGSNDVPVEQQDRETADLVVRLQAGDDMAFRELIERYTSKIYRVAYGILGNRDDADDVAQDAFAEVYFSIKGFAGRSSLYG